MTDYLLVDKDMSNKEKVASCLTRLQGLPYSDTAKPELQSAAIVYAILELAEKVDDLRKEYASGRRWE